MSFRATQPNYKTKININLRWFLRVWRGKVNREFHQGIRPLHGKRNPFSVFVYELSDVHKCEQISGICKVGAIFSISKIEHRYQSKLGKHVWAPTYIRVCWFLDCVYLALKEALTYIWSASAVLYFSIKLERTEIWYWFSCFVNDDATCLLFLLFNVYLW